MAFRRRPSSLLQALVLLLSLALLAVGSLATTGPGDIAVFWGRNKDEFTLREACDTGAYTTVLISFLAGFGGGANAYSLGLSGHPLAGVGDDIKHCQSKGILVLLSICGPLTPHGAVRRGARRPPLGRLPRRLPPRRAPPVRRRGARRRS
jgi:chitinase